jgi:hypothetical protein
VVGIAPVAPASEEDMILENLFTDHPRSLGETYLQHQQHALTFGVTMVVAGIACIVHAIVPSLFETTGSRAVTRLYNRMVLNRKRLSQPTHARDVESTIAQEAAASIIRA